MANTFTLIEAKTLASATAIVTFSAIPATYTDLCLKISARANNASAFGDGIWVYYNGTTSSQYHVRVYGQGNGGKGSTATTSIQYAGMASSDGQLGSTFGNSEIYISNYAQASLNKSSVSSGTSENTSTNMQMQISSNVWSSSAAISSVSLTQESATAFMIGSTFYLYGIKNA